jgi:hypothetical protein
MGSSEKRAYLEAIRPRYRRSGRLVKQRILDEFCSVCEYNRKYAVRLLAQRSARPKLKRGRKPKYGTTVDGFMKVLERIWTASDFMCSRRLKVVIPQWVPYYERTYGPLCPATRSLLLSISSASLDRHLRTYRARLGRGHCGTKPGTMLRNQIPVRTDNWDISRPGYMEADTVAHCGSSMAGSFVWSLTLTDIHSGWTESRAVWNKGADDVLRQVRDIEQRLPFTLLAFDCDNGSEFLNHHLVRYFMDRQSPVAFTRSRPYRKNDNAHVEQKNWAHARHLLDYYRIGNPELVSPINDLYANEWSLYQNLFCPSMKLTSKLRIRSRYRKTYDTPQTPFQRLLNSPHVHQDRKQQLAALHQRHNPFQLRKAIDAKLKAIFKLISVTSFVRQRI